MGGDEAVELADLLDERSEDGDEAQHELAFRLGFEFVGESEGRRAQALQELAGRASAAVGVLLEEALEALGPEARGALGAGVGVEEGEGDGAVEGGEDRYGPGPEALQQAAELIGELAASGDQIVAGADGGTQRLGAVGGSAQRPEAVAVGAQDVGEDVGIAGIALAEGGAVAGPGGLEGVGVDGDDDEACLDQRIDEQAGGPLDGDGEIAGLTEALQATPQLRQSLGCVSDGERGPLGTGFVQDADVVLVAGPVDSGEVAWGSFHAAPPGNGKIRSGVGRSHRSLIDRRSGLQVLGRNTLWSVGAFRAGRRSGSHAGRHAASEPGSLHPDAEPLYCAPNLPRAPRKVGQ